MKISIRLLKISAVVLLVSGCVIPMVPLENVDNSYPIDKSLTKEQVKEAIQEGARYANWTIHDQGENTLLGVYRVRVHSVDVKITYWESSYSIEYMSSHEMKMYCTKQAADEKKGIVLSGKQACPGDVPPYAIHQEYQNWVNDLNSKIQIALESR